MALSSCAIIEGLTLDCRTGMAGIETIYLTEFTNLTQSSVTASSGTITAMSLNSGKKFWEYQVVKEDAQWTDTPTVSTPNGTAFFDQQLSFTIHKMNAKNRNIIKLLIQNRLLAIVKTSDGQYVLLGQQRGLDVVTVAGGSGKAAGDLNGNVITLQGKEPDAANYFSSASIVTAMLV
jgi:hypothetical protein